METYSVWYIKNQNLKNDISDEHYSGFWHNYMISNTLFMIFFSLQNSFIRLIDTQLLRVVKS